MKKGYIEFISYTIVSIVCAAVSFITMMVLTRIIKDQGAFGKINLFINASNLMMSFICFGFDTAFIRFFYEPPKEINAKKLAYICMVPSIIIFIILAIILFAIRDNGYLIKTLGGNGYIYIVIILLNTFSLFLIRYLTVFFRMKSFIFPFALVSVLLVICTRTIYIPLYLLKDNVTENIKIATLFLFLGTIILFCRYINCLLEREKIKIKRYSEVYSFALKNSPVFVITYLNSYIPQVVINSYLGEHNLGIYTALLLFCTAIQVLSTGFTTFWSPYMYKNYKKCNQEISNVHDLVFIGLIFVLSMVLLFNDFLFLFIGENYRNHQNILGLLLIYPIILIVVETTAYGINIQKKNEISLLIYFLSTTSNFVFSILLVKKYDFLGIAIASVISATIQFVLMTIFGQKYYKSINDKKNTSINYCILLIIAIAFYIFYKDRLIFVFIDSVMLIFLFIKNFKLLKWLVESLKVKKNISEG